MTGARGRPTVDRAGEGSSATSGIRCSAGPADHELRLEAVDHTYNCDSPWARPALHGIDVTLPPGERALVVGGNGSGKSTLAWILAGLHRPTRGLALFGGMPLVEHRHRIGLVVQHTRLQLLRATVGSELDAFTNDTDAQDRALRSLGFDPDIRRRRIDELSVGQQRRVGLAVQLARRVPVLILDEPMAGLDRSGRRALVDAVASLEADTTVVTVTHDLDDSRPLGPRILHLEQGRLDQRDPQR